MPDHTTPVLERAVSLHEKCGMPWCDAEPLALREFGVTPDDIAELVGECTSSRILIEGEITAFAISVLVHGSPLLASPAPQELPPVQLPELPEPDGVILVGTQALRAFTASTTEAYALAAIAADRRAGGR